MDVVAEGVETEFEAMMMTKLGCTELQGYYFSRPVAADQMIELLGSFPTKRPAPLQSPVLVSSRGTSSGSKF
jgi:predicted signal transduction protein with EAL and GGDEF domain